MAKDNYGDIILKIAAIVGGAWIAAELIKAFGRERTYYSCPVCNYDIEYGVAQCPNCHTELGWPNQKNVSNEQQNIG